MKCERTPAPEYRRQVSANAARSEDKVSACASSQVRSVGTDGRTGCGSCVGGLAVPGCASCVKAADENYKLSFEIQLGL